MIHETVTSRVYTTTPTTPIERAIFKRMDIHDGGALIIGPSEVGVPPARFILATAAHAAVLEDLARVARVRLTEMEQAAIVKSNGGP